MDQLDYDYLIQFDWHDNGNGYAYKDESGDHIYMHRMIAQRALLNLDREIDHKDRNPRNNRRENLRAATRSQNQMNTSMSNSNTTGYRGVCYDKARRLYMAYIKHQGRFQNLGRFNSMRDAALAYNKAAKRIFGEFAVLNEVQDG